MERTGEEREPKDESPWDKRRRCFGYYSPQARSKTVKVVLDTNILISGSLWFGNPKAILDLAISKKIEVFSSFELVEEFKSALSRDFETGQEELEKKVKIIQSFSQMVRPSKKVFAVLDDPDDNKVLEAALEAKADFIVSGDRHLLKQKEFRGISILAAKEFLELVCK